MRIRGNTYAYTPCQDCSKAGSVTCGVCQVIIQKRTVAHWEQVKHPYWKGEMLDRCSFCGWINEKGAFMRDDQNKKCELKFCGACGSQMW